MELWSNNASSLLAYSIGTSDMILYVQPGQGDRFPNPITPDFFYVTLDDGVHVEVCICTSRSGDTLTVIRAQQGTISYPFGVSSTVENRATAQTLLDLQGYVNYSISTISTETTLGNHNVVVITGGPYTVILPPASSVKGRIYYIKINTAEIITIATTGSDLLDGQSSLAVKTQYTALPVISDGISNWFIL